MRLIDADALRNVFAEKSSEAVCGVKLCKAIIHRINEAPTIDAVPVIRCKDCKRLGVVNMKDKYGQPSPVPCCRRNGHIRLGITPDDYCSRAERREE